MPKDDTKSGLSVRCSACEHSAPLQTYKSEFARIEALLGRMDLGASERLVNEANFKAIEELLACQNKLIISVNDDSLKEKSRDFSKLLNSYSRPLYLTLSRTLDALSRVSCNLARFELADELTEQSIRLLELVYGCGNDGGDHQVEHIEVAHELFKLAEIQCNCRRFQKALASVRRAISIARRLYSDENKILREFHELETNILAII